MPSRRVEPDSSAARACCSPLRSSSRSQQCPESHALPGTRHRWLERGFFLVHEGACRRRSPRANADPKVPTDVPQQDPFGPRIRRIPRPKKKSALGRHLDVRGQQVVSRKFVYRQPYHFEPGSASSSWRLGEAASHHRRPLSGSRGAGMGLTEAVCDVARCFTVAGVLSLRRRNGPSYLFVSSDSLLLSCPLSHLVHSVSCCIGAGHPARRSVGVWDPRRRHEYRSGLFTAEVARTAGPSAASSMTAPR